MENSPIEQQNTQQIPQQETEPVTQEQPVANQIDVGEQVSSIMQRLGIRTADELPSTDKFKRRKVWDRVVSVVLILMIVALVTVILVRCFVVSKVTVSGPSMMPNFKDGQVVRVSKRIGEVNRGDVVVLYKNYVEHKFLAEFSLGGKGEDAYEKLIKRVVGVGGDKLWVEQRGQEYVLIILTASGERLEENNYTVFGQPAMFFDINGVETPVAYLGTKPFLGCLANATESSPYVVREGYFFFLGDNRHNSADSRKLGSLPLHRIYGIVIEK